MVTHLKDLGWISQRVRNSGYAMIEYSQVLAILVNQTVSLPETNLTPEKHGIPKRDGVLVALGNTLCFPWLYLYDSYPSRSESVVLAGRSGRSPKTPCTEKPTQSEVFSAKIWRIEKTAQLHPEKINWKSSICKGNTSSKPSLLCSMLIFRGVPNRIGRTRKEDCAIGSLFRKRSIWNPEQVIDDHQNVCYDWYFQWFMTNMDSKKKFYKNKRKLKFCDYSIQRHGGPWTSRWFWFAFFFGDPFSVVTTLPPRRSRWWNLRPAHPWTLASSVLISPLLLCVRRFFFRSGQRKKDGPRLVEVVGGWWWWVSYCSSTWFTS